MISSASRLRAAYRIYAGREGAPTAGDRWFVVYLIAFLAGWYVLPVAYVIGNFLDPEFAAALTAADVGPQLGAALGLLAVAALWVGRVQGPAFLTPFLAYTLLHSEIDRRRVLGRATISVVIGTGALVCLLAAFGLFSLTHAGAWGWAMFGQLVAAAFLGGIHLGLVAFLGQRLSTRWLTLLSLATVMTAFLGLIYPHLLLLTPAGWITSLWSGGSPWFLGLLGLSAATGLTLLLTVPSALQNLPMANVLTQSHRISQARLFTSSGNVNDAIELFRKRPRRVLPDQAVSGGPAVLAGLRRDLVTAARTPQAVLGAAVLVPAGAALLTVVMPAVGEGYADSSLIATVPTALIGGVLLFLGTGNLAQGWRHLKAEFEAAALFGTSALGALVRHLLWPVLSCGALTLLGSAAAVMLTGGAWAQVGWAAALALIALCARFFQAMRPRDIPVEYLAPTVMPGGQDLSAVKILLWLGDGVILMSTGVLAVVVLPWSTLALNALLTLLGLTALTWGWLRTGHSVAAQAPRKHYAASTHSTPVQ